MLGVNKGKGTIAFRKGEKPVLNWNEQSEQVFINSILREKEKSSRFLIKNTHSSILFDSDSFCLRYAPRFATCPPAPRGIATSSWAGT